MASKTLMDKMKRIESKIQNQKNKYAKLKEGNNYFRFLPSWRGDDEEWCIVAPTHYKVGPNERTVACLNYFAKKCPVCVWMQRLNESNIAADNQLASALRPKPRILLNGLPDNDPEQLIKIVSINDDTFSKLMSVYQDPVAGGDFMDEEEGFVINIKGKKQERGMYSFMDYTVAAAREASYIGREQWYDELYNLDAEVAKNEQKGSEIVAIIKGLDMGNK